MAYINESGLHINPTIRSYADIDLEFKFISITVKVLDSKFSKIYTTGLVLYNQEIDQRSRLVDKWNMLDVFHDKFREILERSNEEQLFLQIFIDAVETNGIIKSQSVDDIDQPTLIRIDKPNLDYIEPLF